MKPYSLTVATLMTVLMATGEARAGKLEVDQLDATKPLPAKLRVKGKRIVQSWRWKASDGIANYVVLSTTSTTTKRGESRVVFAQIFTGAKLVELRLIKDAVENCQLDLTASFVAGSLTITDEDADGTPEIAFAYDLDCDATAKPTPRKLIVVEGAAKHALRGRAIGADPDGKVLGGDFKADFQNAPKLQQWAEARWKTLLTVQPVDVDP